MKLIDFQYCSKCDRELPLSAFPKSKYALNKLNSVCKLCKNTYDQEYYYNKDKEKKAKRVAEYQKNNYEKHKNVANASNMKAFRRIKNFIENRIFYPEITRMGGGYSFKKIFGMSAQNYADYIATKLPPDLYLEGFGASWSLKLIFGKESFDLSNLKERRECFHYSNFEIVISGELEPQMVNFLKELENGD